MRQSAVFNIVSVQTISLSLFVVSCLAPLCYGQSAVPPPPTRESRNALNTDSRPHDRLVSSRNLLSQCAFLKSNSQSNPPGYQSMTLSLHTPCACPSDDHHHEKKRPSTNSTIRLHENPPYLTFSANLTSTCLFNTINLEWMSASPSNSPSNKATTQTCSRATLLYCLILLPW